MQRYNHGEEQAGKERGFRELATLSDRLDYLEKHTPLTHATRLEFEKFVTGGAGLITGPRKENFLAEMRIPIGVIPKISVNGVARAVPMLIEEASVIAGVSNAVKTADFKAAAAGTITVGHIQILDVPEERIEAAIASIKEHGAVLVKTGNTKTDGTERGHIRVLGIEPRAIDTGRGKQIIVRFSVECLDAQGAGVVSEIGTSMMPRLNRITGGYPSATVLTNLPLDRVVVCEATFDKDALAGKYKNTDKAMEGPEVVRRILDIQAWAEVDQERATTHNKGIMNGIIAVAAALLQDTRAIEAGAHSYASYKGRYMPLSSFSADEDGNLVGRLEVPIAVGTVGGAFDANPILAKFLLEMMGCKSAKETAEVMAAVGLAQNVAALRMLVTTGIPIEHKKFSDLMKNQAADLIRS